MHLLIFHLFFFFFFYSSAHHRDLHSFPTRRSSDLVLATPMSGFFKSASEKPTALSIARAGDAQSCGLFGCRSEEHTSELQSHSDLVCRLLLEKKKNNADNNA